MSRVQVNQRALIDKILARYAAEYAVYRELLQNSNDADATTAEIHFTCNPISNAVTEVRYRNNGKPFRPQDWDRLKEIAAGNPDSDKVGAFGVGAYTIFSVCEEPMVASGDETLCFFWKGNELWAKMTDAHEKQGDSSQWTSFILPSRDPYQLPDLETFGEFLCASLTFMKNLKMIRVLVNDQERLSIIKTLVQEPRSLAHPDKSCSSWLDRISSSASVSTSSGIFTLTPNSIIESIYRITISYTPALYCLGATRRCLCLAKRVDSHLSRPQRQDDSLQRWQGSPLQHSILLFLVLLTRSTEQYRLLLILVCDIGARARS